MTRHIRFLLALLIVGCCCSKATAEYVTYAFESAQTGLYGKITFDDANENFAPGGTATYCNGAIVDYWFERGDNHWDLADGWQSPVIQFGASGAGPDDIVSCGYDAFDFERLTGYVPTIMTELLFAANVATNGNHAFEIWAHNNDILTSDLLARGTDGAFRLVPTAPNSIELHSVIIEENRMVRVEYSKNYSSRAELYRESPFGVAHNSYVFFGQSGEHVVDVAREPEFYSLTAGERVFLTDVDYLSASVTVTNRPVANAGPDQRIECTGGAAVQLDGTGTYDPNGDAISLLWIAPAGVVLDDPTSPAPLGLFPLGVTMVTLVVTDEHGASQTDDVVITVYDTPPQVACTADTASLAPADHLMVPVGVYVDATDACDAPERLRLARVTIESSEPDDARGKSDGSTTGDTNGTDGYTSPADVTDAFVYNPQTQGFEATVYLRAEVDANGPGRAYSINATVIDTSGNLAHASCVVVVPLDDSADGNGGGKGMGNGKGPKK